MASSRRFISPTESYTSRVSARRMSSRHVSVAEITLGELLINMANEGVRILMLVWDERTSVKLLKNDGMLAAHDKDTVSYFRNTRPRATLTTAASFAQGLEIGTMFTHHQKLVVVDVAMPNGSDLIRMMVSFVGENDLCDDRYDTQNHSMFRTLNTVHRDDFHQANSRGATSEKTD